ncbi:hypothetical protein MMC10_009052 [Thelotrema lepadinum]|nr:hypothetical protein [Thelotrema lepadinum]
MGSSLHADRQSTSAASTERSLLSTLTWRQHEKAHGDSQKGPLGLTTLYEPPETQEADLIFVHGLGGGSQSTWSKPGADFSFWPRDWLPVEPSFQNVRIHTFGYNSNWAKESTLNIHDFAKSLLGAIKNCPAIPRGSTAPIVFIAHSMGGLVIKRAYILARQIDEFESIGTRVKAIFFLATPHRGSDLAQTLSRILSITSGARPFVTDLQRNSLATQSINDEFPQHCMGLQIYSFYETTPVHFVVGKDLIVTKDSAVLGLPNERTEYLDGNHREICKFRDTSDRNYVTVRNAIAAVLADLNSGEILPERLVDLEQERAVSSFLGILDAPEDDFLVAEQRRIGGSCEWLLRKDSFQKWQTSSQTKVFWISAKPATGKSILSGYAIRHLRNQGQDCAFFFFTHFDQFKTSISCFLCSIAWQMAQLHSEVFTFLAELSEKEQQITHSDYRTIWRKLFLEGILRFKLTRPQTIVVDALDECKHDGDLIHLLLKIAESVHIRLFVTSRNHPESFRLSLQARSMVISEGIQDSDTKNDIRLFLEANIHNLPLAGDDACQEMVEQILAKSDNCFLWVNLVLKELEQVHTSAEIRAVLEEVPSDMDDLYSRILQNMSRVQRGKKLAKAILIWAVCAARPLTTTELGHALQIDIQDSVNSIEKSISTVCGHLVFVDSQSRVQMIHLTAREFLLHSSFESEFMVNKKEAHRRLCIACLKYLNGKEMESSRGRKLSAQRIHPERCEFVTYAAHQLFEHILHVTSSDDDILFLVAKFLSSTNTLSWIEYLAQVSSLNRLIQTGRSLRNFLHRRSKHTSPLGKEVALLDNWSVDLVRLVTKFGRNLLASPSSIFKLIPPFCPSESCINKQFTSSVRGISVHGLSATIWNDCLSTLYYHQKRTSAIACSDKYFVVGLSNGQAIVYNEMTCQDLMILHNEGPVRIMKFGENGEILAICCVKKLFCFKVGSWDRIWAFELPAQCMALTFMDNDALLLAASKKNELLVWNLYTGEPRDPEDWTSNLSGLQTHTFRSPITAAFSTTQGLLAIVYRGQDILVWSLEGDIAYETYSKDMGLVKGEGEKEGAMVTVLTLVFSNTPETSLLAAAYSDGDLVTFDTAEGTVKETVYANAQTLACSSDGQTLACGDSNGTIQLFDFETLRHLYRINSEDYGIKALAFNATCDRLLDIRGSHCRIWDPLVLMRQSDHEEQSDTVSISTNPQETSMASVEDGVEITAITCHDDEEVFFCGKEDGSVGLYEVKSGLQSTMLFSHTRGVSINSLLFDSKSQLLCSTDSSSRVMIHEITRDQRVWTAAKPILDHRTGIAIDQLVANKGCSRVLLSSTTKDILFVVSAARASVLKTLVWEDRGPYRWVSHPADEHIVILMTNHEAYMYTWLALDKVSFPNPIALASSLSPDLNIQSVIPCFAGNVLAAVFARAGGSYAQSKLVLWDAAEFTMDTERIDAIPDSRAFADHVELLIGDHRDRVVYLDNSGWVFSASPDTFDRVRHFFVPADWLRTTDQLLLKVTRNGDILFVNRHEVAVIKRSLISSDAGSRTPLGKRPSLLSARSPSNRRKSEEIRLVGRDEMRVFANRKSII